MPRVALQAAEHPVPRGVHRIRRAEQCRGQEAGPGGLVPRQRRFQGARLMQQLPRLPGQVMAFRVFSGCGSSMCLGFLDPDPLVRYRSGSFHHPAKIVRKTMIPTVL